MNKKKKLYELSRSKALNQIQYRKQMFYATLYNSHEPPMHRRLRLPYSLSATITATVACT